MRRGERSFQMSLAGRRVRGLGEPGRKLRCGSERRSMLQFSEWPPGNRAPAVWEDIARALLVPRAVVMMLGARDSGKSCCMFWMARYAAAHGRRVWLVDADLGQSDVGPPAAVGAAPLPPDLPCCRDSPRPRAPLDAKRLYFVGAVSPRGCTPEVVQGTVRAVVDAQAAGADLVVLNTDGYVDGHEAVAMKVAQIDGVLPAAVLVMGDQVCLRDIIDPFRYGRRPRFLALPLSSHLRPRPEGERRQARIAAFCKYFAGSRERVIPLSQCGVGGISRKALVSKDSIGRVVGLYGHDGCCRALGVVTAVRSAGIDVATPLAASQSVSRVQAGSLVLTPEEAGLAEVPPLPARGSSGGRDLFRDDDLPGVVD